MRDLWKEPLSAEESLRLAEQGGYTGVICWTCRSLIPIAGDRRHVIRRNQTNTQWLIRCSNWIGRFCKHFKEDPVLVVERQARQRRTGVVR